jgi:hypothetical protein
MTSSNNSSAAVFQPEQLDQLFSPEQQRTYSSVLIQRGGLTRPRAEYFVRLWAYLLLKHRQATSEQSSQPLTILYPPETAVPCTHREAAELFYGDKERGSDRAAGMMIDRFVALGLLDKHFDGQSLCLQIRAIPELATLEKQSQPATLKPDLFNPRTDAVPIANLFTRSYAELVKDPAATSQKVAKFLRVWSQQYAKGMRVLRRCDNANPVAIYALFPIATESEFYFFQPPSKSFFLTTDLEIDPFKVAAIGDETCTSAYIRAWAIEPAYMQGINIYLMAEDTRNTLIQMQADFPNLCDVHSLLINPIYEELRSALGFQKTIHDPQRSYCWIYLALDHLLSLDIRQALSTLKPKPNPEG